MLYTLLQLYILLLNMCIGIKKLTFLSPVYIHFTYTVYYINDTCEISQKYLIKYF